VLADQARHFVMLDDPDWFYAQLNAFPHNAGSPPKPPSTAAPHRP
jgi:hypothetical protein